MALKIQPSFTTGELDPALHERTNLDKYKSGLATARNVIIGKSGRLLSRPGRRNFIQCKTDGKKVKIHAMSHNGSFLEWGDLYVRMYEVDGTLVFDLAHAFTEAQLDDIHFTDIDFSFVLITQNGQTPLILNVISGGAFVTGKFDLHATPISLTITGAATGYNVDYQTASVKNGIESAPITVATEKKPIGSEEHNMVTAVALEADKAGYQSVRIYRRPRAGGAFGLVGTTTSFAASSGEWRATFIDHPGDADFAQNPPTFSPTIYDEDLSGPEAFQSQTAIMYQQRLIFAYGEKIEASRAGFPYNFYRDYPYTDGSSLSLQAGSNYSRVLRMIDSDGLVVFTSNGVFVHTGALNSGNLALNKKGNWVIDVLIPPLAIPGGVLFVDVSTNTVRQLLFSTEGSGYLGVELSIFSNHLFNGNRVKSWAFQDGDFPLLWVTFTDGTYASFTYERDHKMRAWTRHDSANDVEYVATTTVGTNVADTAATLPNVIFVIKSGTKRFIEFGVPRSVSATISEADAESDKNESIAAMDSMVSYSHLINDDLTDDALTITPVVPGDFTGDLTLSCVDDAIFLASGIGAIGTVFRFFDSEKVAFDLTITARANDNSVTVSPNVEYPSGSTADPRLYEAKITFTGLDHLDGESVSVVSDGHVISSPNNNKESYATSTPSSGSLTLAEASRGAFVHIGRPYVSDIETLDIDTVEQRPVLVESMTINKLYIKVFNSRGFYMASRLPAGDTLTGTDSNKIFTVDMGDIARIDVDYEAANPIIGDRYDQPVTKRIEVNLDGDWQSQGKVAIRSVDPVHFEILSIMPDVEDLPRYNRSRGEEE